MRKNRTGREKNGYTIMIVDDDIYILDALKQNFDALGYLVETQNDPLKALERMRQMHYDILLLDFIMQPICGDTVVSRLREFDDRTFVIMLTGHKELAPPLNTIRELDIQGYYEKSDRYDQLELLVESCVKSIKQIRTISRYQEGLSEILSAIPRMHQTMPMEDTSRNILNEYIRLVGCENGFLWIKPEAADNNITLIGMDSNVFVGRGIFDKKFRQFMEEDYCQMKEILQKALKEKSIQCNEKWMILPLLRNCEVVLGMICVERKENMDATLRALLAVYSEQVTTALHNNILKIMINANNKSLKEANEQIRESYMQTVEAMRLLVDAKDLYTRGHSDRVAFYAVELAKKAGKDENYIHRIQIGGLLHDIGKIGVSDNILCKPGRLNEKEFAVIKRHPEMGKQILSCMTMFDNLGDIVCAHHERYDGSGYPNGLKGTDIPEEARMITIADSFDAMMSDRHYRNKLSLESSIKQLIQGKGTQFDSRLVDLFLQVLEDYDTIAEQLQWTHESVQE